MQPVEVVPGRSSAPPSVRVRAAFLGAVIAALWLLQLLNAASGYRAVRYGLGPHHIGGLRGLVTEPLISGSFAELAVATIPFVVLSWCVLCEGVRAWLIATVVVAVFGGALTWMFGPSNRVFVGLDGLVFGYLGYFFVRGLSGESRRWVFWSLAGIALFWTATSGVLPGVPQALAWQAKVAGLNGGLAAAALLHPNPRPRDPSAVS